MRIKNALFFCLAIVLSGCGAQTSSNSTETPTPQVQSPVAKAGGPYSGIAGTPVSYSGAGSSDPQGQALTYAWNFGDTASATGVGPTHTYTSAGTYTVSLTVTDTSNLSSTATSQATIMAAALPPVPSAGGPYTGTAGTAITFSGAASSDPQGQTLAYGWNFGDSTSATGVSPAHVYASAGTYTVSLTVTDTSNLSATATSKATIVAALKAPVPSAGGPYAGTAGSAVAFSAAGSSDPQGQTLVYAWNFGDSATAVGLNPTHVYSTAGTYIVSLTATDTSNLSATATTRAAIATAPQPPLPNAGGPYAGTTGTAVNFSAAGSTDPQGQTLFYTWSFGDGATATGIAPTHMYSAAGTYSVTLTAADTSNLSATATTKATIAAVPQPPVPSAGGPYTGTVGTAVNFSAVGSRDPQGQALSYAWVFGDGTTGTGINPTHAYAAAGMYTVSLTVTDTSNLSATLTTEATIAVLKSPIANIGGPYTGTAGTAISFSAAGSSDPQGQALSYVWNFGDTTTATGINPSHIYAAAGTYAVSVVVTDTSNLSMNATTRVTIAAAPLPPVAVNGGPYAGIARLAFNFDGSASHDPQGQTLIYMWNFGDGTTGTGATPTHTYQTTGSYPISLIVVNSSGLSATATTVANIVNQGTVYNGVNPLSGAKLYVLAANTTGYGQASRSLLTSSLIGTDSIGGYIRTQGNGGFTITGDYICSPGDQVYLYVDGTEFSGGTYMGVLGACPAAGNFAAALPTVTINQVTTVAAAFALAGFASDPSHISSSGSSRALAGVANAFLTAGSLSSIASGAALSAIAGTGAFVVPGTSLFIPGSGAIVPQAELNSLANIIQSMNGESASAAINIAHNPGDHVSTLFNVQSTTAPFQPSLTAAPHDWTVKIFYVNVGGPFAFDSLGNFWSGFEKYSPKVNFLNVASAQLPPYTGTTITSGFNVQDAVDPDDNVWVLSNAANGQTAPYNLNKFDSKGNPLTPATGITGNGMGSVPTSIDTLVSDGLGNVWIAAAGSTADVSKYLSDGSVASQSPFMNLAPNNGTNAYAPGLAIDSSENVWIANPSGVNSTVTKLTNSGANAVGSPFYSNVNGGFDSLAIDHSSNEWASKLQANAVFEYTSPGNPIPGSLYTDGLNYGPFNLAFDGAGNLWGSDTSQSGIVAIDSAGNRITPAEGFGQMPPPTGASNVPTNIYGYQQPQQLAIDGSGNLWVSGGVYSACSSCSYPYTLGVFQFVGLTAPVVTPLSYAVKTNTLATRP